MSVGWTRSILVVSWVPGLVNHLALNAHYFKICTNVYYWELWSHLLSHHELVCFHTKHSTKSLNVKVVKVMSLQFAFSLPVCISVPYSSASQCIMNNCILFQRDLYIINMNILYIVSADICTLKLSWHNYFVKLLCWSHTPFQLTFHSAQMCL